MLSAFTSAAYIQVHSRQDFFMEANNMNPDQTRLICDHIVCNIVNLPKNISRPEEQMTKVMTGCLRVNIPVPFKNCL